LRGGCIPVSERQVVAGASAVSTSQVSPSPCPLPPKGPEAGGEGELNAKLLEWKRDLNDRAGIGYTNPKRKRGNVRVRKPPSLTLRVSVLRHHARSFSLESSEVPARR